MRTNVTKKNTMIPAERTRVRKLLEEFEKADKE